MLTLQTVDAQLKQHALERYQFFGRTSMHHLLTPAPAFHQISQTLLDFLLAEPQAVNAWFQTLQQDKHTPLSAEMLNFLSQHMLDYMHARNQYLRISRSQQDQLRAAYHKVLTHYYHALQVSQDRETLRQSLEQAMREHQNELMLFVCDTARENGGLEFVLQEPVCSTYSAELQLSVLGLRIEQMIEPILDIGCGQDARLVTALDALGKQAHGIDRMVQKSRFLDRVDWFEYAIRANHWGTIIAHMSFSTHFLHHHMRQDGHPEQYARYYMEILRALKIGGSFAYTPGLPFIESLLPRTQYAVRQYVIRGNVVAMMDAALQKKIGTSVSYATVITRLH